MLMLDKYKDIMTVADLCEALGIGKNTAYKLLKSGEIKSVRIGRIYKIPKQCVEKYIQLTD